MGSLAADAIKVIALARQTKRQTKDEIRIEKARKLRPPLSRILSLADMEVWFNGSVAFVCI
jgi:L-lactate dehydrogenase (cytochrome)